MSTSFAELEVAAGTLRGWLPSIDLAAEDFSDFKARAIYTAARAIVDRDGSDALNFNSLADELTNRSQFKAVGELSGFSDLEGHAIDRDSLEIAAARVRRAGLERRAREAVSSVAASDLDPRKLREARRAIEALEVAAEGPAKSAPSTIVAAWTPLDSVDWLGSTEPPRREYVFEYETDKDRFGFLPAHRVGLVVGAGGVGKSFCSIEAVLSVASGAPWLGVYSCREPGRAVLLAGEEDRDELWRRIRAAADVMQLDAGQLDLVRDRLVVLPLAGEDVRLREGQDRGGGLTATFADLAQRLEAEGPWSLVVVDPLSRFGSADFEIDNVAATATIQALERLTQVAGRPTVLALHHTSKVGRSGGADATAARGSSGLVDGARWVALLEAVTRGKRTCHGFTRFKLVKTNYGRFAPDVVLAADPTCGGALRPATEAEIANLNATSEGEEGANVADEIDDRIVRAIANSPERGLVQSGLEATVGGNHAQVRARIAALAAEGRIWRSGDRKPWRLRGES